MTWLLLGQLAIPTVLALWAWIRPARSTVGLLGQLFVSLTGLALLHRVGLWLFPPWWTPYAAAALVALGGVRAGRRVVSRRPEGALARSGVAACAALGAAATARLLIVLAAARTPPDAIELAFPLPEGRYLVVNGGTDLLINAHRESMDTTVVRLRPWRGNGHAVDLVAMSAVGLRAPGLVPEDPAVYEIFAVPVLAPCTGSVARAVDGLADMRVPLYDRENMAGNHVLIACDGVHVLLAHLARGSVRVHEGDPVAAGAVVGAVGNSGGTNEPHLHVHAQRPGPPGAPFGGDPVPMLLDGRFLVRGDRVRVRP